jgi:hypothetical protein
MKPKPPQVNGVIFIPPQPDPGIVNETQHGGRPCHPRAIHDAFTPIGVDPPKPPAAA